MTINKIRSFLTLRFLLLTGVFALGFTLKGAAQGSPIQLSLSFTAPTCAGYADGSATAAASGGVAPYSFLWNNGLTTATILNLQAGTYSVTVSDVAGATAVGSIQVVAPAPLHFQVTVTLPSCNGGAGAMTLFPVGGTSPYDVVWSNGVIGVTANNLQPGVPYTVQATDLNGCQLDTTVLLPVIDSLSVSLLIKKAECAGVEDGTATALVNPPGGSYQYQWNVSPNNTQQITNLAPGTVVTVTVTDVNTGCVGTASGVIGTHTQVTLQVTGSGNVMCAGDTTGAATAIAGHGTSPYTYVWNGPGINNVPGPTITGLGPGAYSVTATDAHGCTAAGGVSIGVISGLHADFSLSKDCIANQFRVTFTDQSTDPGSSIVAWDWHITWSGGSFNTTQKNPPTLLLPNQSTGIAQLIVTSASGCQDTLARAFKVDSLLDYTVLNPGYSCEGAPINIKVLGDSTFTYKWTPTDNLTFTPGPQNVVADPPQTTTYLLTVSNGLCFDVDSITVTRQPLLTLDAPDVSTCDTSATLSATTSVPATLIWTNVSGDTINPASVLGGTYYVTATDSFKCVRKDSAEVSVLAAAVQANVPPNACPNTPFGLTTENLNAADTVTYLWTAVPSGLVIDNPAAAVTTAAGTAGTYTVTLVATNQAGCTQTLTFPVNIQDSLNLTGQITISQLCNSTAVTFVNHSGIPGQWNFGDNMGTSTQDSVTYPYAGPGLYPVTFTSAAACVLPFAQQVNVTPDVFTVTAEDVTGCGVTAALTATVSAGGTVSWTDLNNLPVDPAGVGAGMYIAIGTDSTNQCQDRDTVTVALSPASVNATVPASACVNTPIDLTAESLNGGDVVTYVWTSSPSGLVIANPAAAVTTAAGTVGTYTVTLVATNQAGCTQTLTFPVNIQDSLNLTGQITISQLCNSTAVTFVNHSGIPGQWNFGDNMGTSTQDSVTYPYAGPGLYPVTFTSAAACVLPFAQQVDVTPDVFTVTAEDVTGCGVTAALTATVSAGGTVSWTDLNNLPVDPCRGRRGACI